MTKKETTRGDVEETVNQPDEEFSCLFAVMNSGKFWRCIKWQDKGSTVLIISPVLLEKQALQSGEWKQQLKANGV